MKMLKKNKKIVTIVSCVILGLIVIGVLVILYINPAYQKRNKLLIDNIDKLLVNEEVTLEELIPFDFDSVYLFEPYSYKKDMESQIGIRSRFIKDNYTDNLGTEMIVVKNNKVISSTFIKLEKNGFIIEGLIYSNKLDKNSNVVFEIKKHETGVFIRQKLKYYNDSFEDIVYTVPGEWWKESLEVNGYFYYVDDDSQNYLIIRNEELFTKNNFVKYVENEVNVISSLEKVMINNFEGYHLIGRKEDIISHYISLNIKSDSYIFILNGKENVIDNLYVKLQGLLESINVYNEG